MAFNKPYTNSYLLPLLCGILVGLAPIVPAQVVYWTGDGDGSLWSDPINWDDHTLPTAADTVVLGDPAHTPDAPLNITLDIPDVAIAALQLAGTGDRTLHLTYQNTTNLTILTTNFIWMLESATADAVIDVPIHNTGDVRRIRNESLDALLTFSQPFTSTATGADNILGQGLIRFNARLADKAYAIYAPQVVLNIDDTVIARHWRPQEGHECTLLANNAPFARNLGPVTDFNLAIVESGDEVRSFTFAYGIGEGSSNKRLTIIDSPDGSTGRVRINLGRVSLYAFARNRLSIVTRAGDTVRLYRDGEAHIGYADYPRIAGAGDFMIDSSTAGYHNLESALTYSGRTIISKGNLILTNGVDGVVEFRGALPSATILEIAQNGKFYLNGLDQTIGGLTGYSNTYGQVFLDGATLTINSVSNTAFAGQLNGGGALAKQGPAIFEITPGWTNVAGRQLRVEEGLLAVGGNMDMTAGGFALAGGRVAAPKLNTQNATWDILLNDLNAGAVMVDVSGEADITDATLNIAMAPGYQPRLGDTFTLLRASSIVGAAPGGTLFQYNDGQLFEADGRLFRIMLIDNSIVLRAAVGGALIKIR